MADNTEAITVPERHVFLLGDNRDNAADSRILRAIGGFGPVSVAEIFAIVEVGS